MGFIYKITNTISGKHYIGETVQANPENRWKKHIHSLKTTKGCPALKDAMKKYGVDKFKFEIIIICFDDDRYKYEKEYIKKFNSQVPNGYNILLGGEIGESRLGIKHTDEAKKKMSDAHKRRNEANVNYIEKYKKEDTRTVAEKENDTKNKIKDSVLLYYKNGGITKHREAMIKAVGRKISQYSKENIFIKEYNSTSEASRELNINHKNIERILYGRGKLAGGFIWRYSGDTDKKNKKHNIEKHREAIIKAVGRKIAQYSIDNVFIQEYNSITEAARCLNLRASNIHRVLSGTRKTLHGFIWKYVNEKNLKA